MKGRTIAIVALAAILVCTAAAVIALGGDGRDDAEAKVVDATVWLDGGGEPEKLEGSGATMSEILESALSGHDVVTRSNGNIASIDGRENVPRQSSWAVFVWSSPGGWTEYKGSDLVDGMTLAVRYSDRVVDEDGTVSYEKPDIPVKYKVYYFIKVQEGGDSTDWLRRMPLSEDVKQEGFWISGEGTNNNEALADAVSKLYGVDAVKVDGTTESPVEGSESKPRISYTEYVVEGRPDFFKYGTSQDMYGWFLMFLGQKDTKNPDGSYTYWTQFSYNPAAKSLDDPDCWDYNDWSFGLYDISKYRYFGLVLKSGMEDDRSGDLGTPSEIPEGL